MDGKLQRMIQVLDIIVENMKVLGKCCEELREVVIRQKQIAESLLGEIQMDVEQKKHGNGNPSPRF